MTNFQKRQVYMMALIAIAMTATIATAFADSKADIEFCQQYKEYAETQREAGNRYEYATAKRLFQACLNSARSKNIDPGDIMYIHEQNDREIEVPSELSGDRYKN